MRDTTLPPYACLLCLSPRHKVIGDNPDFRESRVLACRSCGFMWTAPAPAESTLEDLYQAHYRQLRGEALSEDHLTYKDARAAAQRSFIVGHTNIAQVNRLKMLDVGCAAGSLLRSFEEGQTTDELVGFEPDRSMAAAARLRLGSNARVHTSAFKSIAFANDTFDLVTASHSLEHVADPISFLSDLWRITRREGILFLEVPHETRSSVKGIVRARHKGLMHLLFFSLLTLRESLRKAGWKEMYMSTFGPDLASFSVVPQRSGAVDLYRAKLRRRVRRYLGCREPEPRRVDWIGAYSRESPNGGIWIRVVAEKTRLDDRRIRF